MKKVFATVLLVTYFAFSSGVVINYHYCMNELASAKIFEKDQGVCGACGMHNNNDGCCHDEVKVLKAEDEQSVPATLTLVINAPKPGNFPSLNFYSCLFKTWERNYTRNHLRRRCWRERISTSRTAFSGFKQDQISSSRAFVRPCFSFIC